MEGEEDEEERREVKACGECVDLSSAKSEKADTFNVSNCFFVCFFFPFFGGGRGILVKSVSDLLGGGLWK